MPRHRLLFFPFSLFLLGLSLLVVLAALAGGTPPAAAAPLGSVIFVDADAGGANNGTSWADAFPKLQDALAAAVSGDEIWVAEGVYYPDEGGSQTDNNRSATFQLKNGVTLYGGFAGSETAESQRDWEAHVTVLSGDIDQNDTVDANGVVTDTANIAGSNSYHVTTGGAADATAVLDGFTVTAGQANGSSADGAGGGMHNNGGSPTLNNVTFSGNSAGNGGGMYNNGSSPALNNVTFSGNSASSQGGGMYNNSSSNPTLNNVTFSGNDASAQGGGMYNFSGSPTLTSVTFSGNSALSGGGMYNDSSSTALTSVSFSGNSASAQGGGMFNLSSSPMLTSVTFSGNSANHGGGMYNANGSSPMLIRVSFSGNSANSNGGGMYNVFYCNPILTNVSFSGNRANYGGGMRNDTSSSPTLTNVSFSGNRANTLGGGMFNGASSSPTIQNSIFWNNQDASGTGTAAASISNSSTPTVRDSDVQGCGGSGSWVSACGADGGNNIDSDPLFVADVDPSTAPTSAGNLRLHAGSPAMDSGDNNADLDAGGAGTATISDIPTDLDGLARMVGGTVDLGAFESQYATECGVSAPNSYILGATMPVTVTVTSAGDLDCITATYFPTSHPQAISGLQTGGFWALSGQASGGGTASGFDVNLTLPASFTPDANSKVCRYTGSGTIWDCNADSFSAANGTVTRNGVTAFSDWTAGENLAPTAVDINDFRGSAVWGRGAELHWETATESELSGFHIWRGSAQKAETRLTASLIGAAGGLTGHAYSWQDGAPLAWGERAHYWLEAVHADGGSRFTGPVAVVGSGRLFLPRVGK